MGKMKVTSNLLREYVLLSRRLAKLEEFNGIQAAREYLEESMWQIILHILDDRIHDVSLNYFNSSQESRQHLTISDGKKSVQIWVSELRNRSPETLKRVVDHFQWPGDLSFVKKIKMKRVKGLPFGQEKGGCTCLHPKNRHSRVLFKRTVSFWDNPTPAIDEVEVAYCLECNCPNFSRITDENWLNELNLYSVRRKHRLIHFNHETETDAMGENSKLHELWLGPKEQSHNIFLASGNTLEEALTLAQPLIEHRIGHITPVEIVPLAIAQIYDLDTAKRALEQSNGLLHAVLLHTYGEEEMTQIFALSEIVLDGIVAWLQLMFDISIIKVAETTFVPAHINIAGHLQLQQFRNCTVEVVE